VHNLIKKSLYLIDDGGAQEILVSPFPEVKMWLVLEWAATFLHRQINNLMIICPLCSIYFKAGRRILLFKYVTPARV
jgi:hypothetical protein